ncbi:MAG: flavodoxin family protein [Lachnospiraceae bacterium]|nr:flavodoxin family protein [Lachnospiraceae bacterium]
MKVLGLAMGRRNGNSEILLKHALKACEDEGLEVALVRLHDYKIQPCTGCELCTKCERSGEPMRCMYPWDSDDMKQLADMIEAADGLICAAPAYHLMPPGIGMVMLNRNHCCIDSPRHRGEFPFVRRVCASIGVGGSDWTSLFMPILNFIGTEMLGSRMHLVDQMKLHRTPAVGMVLCNQEALDRATQLGKNVAYELKKTEGPVEYHGEEGVCPICHNSIVVIRNGRMSCATCDYEGDPIIENGKITGVKWDGDIEATRWSMHGHEHHDAEQFTAVKFEKGKGYVFTEEQKELMTKGREEWGRYLEPVMPKR